jgi:hypothetical protein
MRQLLSLSAVSALAIVVTASGGCNQTPAPLGTAKHPYGDYRYVAYDNAGIEVRSGTMTLTPVAGQPGRVAGTIDGGSVQGNREVDGLQLAAGDGTNVSGYLEDEVFFGHWTQGEATGKVRAFREEAPELERGFPRGWGWASMTAWSKTGAP